MNTDVLIIGGGPAGLSAALELASRNLHVTIVDESRELGGQLRQQTQVLESLPPPYESMRGYELADKLVGEVDSLSIHQLLEHRVIGFYEDGRVGVSDDRNVGPISPKKIIFASGAYEKAVAFLKWTLPGIMTIGAAQTLINRDLVLPGNETVIVGISNFSLDVVEQLQSVGVHVKAMLELTGQTQPYSLEKLEDIKSTGVAIYQQAEMIEAKGTGRVEELVINHEGQQKSLQVEFVCIDGGRSPITDLFYQVNCSFGYQEALGGWLPQYDSRFKTSNDNVFLAGNASGISHPSVLLLTGKIAAIGAAEELQMIEKQEAEVLRNVLWKEIEIIESREFPYVWTARKEHVEHFLKPKIKDQFIS